MFIQDKSETLIGRDKELQLLFGYARGESGIELGRIGKAMQNYCCCAVLLYSGC